MNNYTLPTSIIVNDEPFGISEKGDFRMVLSLFNIISNVELSPKERIFASLIRFYGFEDFDDLMTHNEVLQELTDQMMWFLDCGQQYDNAKNSPRLIDWDKDSNLICSAINVVAGKEIRAESYLHWWTFVSYYMGIGECALSTIVGIRYKKAKNKKLEKHEKEFMRENPQYFNHDYRTAEQVAADNYVKSLWEGGTE